MKTFAVVLASLVAGSSLVLAQDGPYTLPPLPYEADALEPHIDAETMKIHHGKHHKAYVDNANKLLADQPQLAKMSPEDLIQNLDKAPEAIRDGLRNNVGGHINHSMFWQMMSPKGGGKPSGPLADAIEKEFGSFENFQKQFDDAAKKRFGSGWAWLVLDDGKLKITSTPNQDPPIMAGQDALLGLDVWEHAYYLKYQNRRPEYITAWWNVVNWPHVQDLYSKAVE
ncbi:MAG: superoxide dismutase [Terrimicrobiaceae bacterium]|nr:superoxide dismutase [Terrimicrobiaceae bacterium]